MVPNVQNHMSNGVNINSITLGSLALTIAITDGLPLITVITDGLPLTTAITGVPGHIPRSRSRALLRRRMTLPRVVVTRCAHPTRALRDTT
jgi:hypothetical protein